MSTTMNAWGWKIAVYLFVSGTGAGACAVGVIGGRLGAPAALTTAALALGPLLVAPATLLLIWDLGRPTGFARAARRPGTSWISRGVVILSAFIAVSALHAALGFARLDVATSGWLGTATGLLAVLTMVYTGLLLGAVRPIPFWSTPILPVLFVTSSLSTGVMTVDLVATAGGLAGPAAAPLTALRALDCVLLAIEAALLALYLSLARSTVAARAASALLTTGALAPRFWGGVVVAGLAAPFVIQLAELAVPSAALTILSSALGLAGGLMLRHLVIAGGVKAPLHAAGILVSVPGRANVAAGR